jgi:hypothetical protein
MSSIIERIERELGVPGIVSLLAEHLSPTDLQSLLLEVYRQRAERRTPKEVLTDYESNRFVHPSTLSATRLFEWELIVWSNLSAAFEAIALSPVAPLGTCSVVASVNQNNAVSTSRNSEVVSDSTNALALECAVRRRNALRVDPRSTETVHLAASHRLMRPQFSTNPKMLPHFQLLALCSAGRDTGSLQFETEALILHISTHLTLLRTFLGEGVKLRLLVTDFAPSPRLERLESELLVDIRSDFPDVECGFNQDRTTGRGYYHDLCFHIYVDLPDGSSANVSDGGSVDWTQQYLSSAKERLIISGIGSERVVSLSIR